MLNLFISLVLLSVVTSWKWSSLSTCVLPQWFLPLLFSFCVFLFIIWSYISFLGETCYSHIVERHANQVQGNIKVRWIWQLQFWSRQCIQSVHDFWEYLVRSNQAMINSLNLRWLYTCIASTHSWAANHAIILQSNDATCPHLIPRWNADSDQVAMHGWTDFNSQYTAAWATFKLYLI